MGSVQTPHSALVSDCSHQSQVNFSPACSHLLNFEQAHSFTWSRRERLEKEEHLDVADERHQRQLILLSPWSGWLFLFSSKCWEVIIFPLACFQMPGGYKYSHRRETAWRCKTGSEKKEWVGVFWLQPWITGHRFCLTTEGASIRSS